MNIQSGLKRWRSVGAIVLLVAAAGTTIGGIQGTGFRALAAIGTVETDDGGLQVSGRPYDTSHARVIVNGRPGDVSQVRKGHIVTVGGSVSTNGSTAIADEIDLESDVRGEISAVNRGREAFSVLGQTIQLDDASVFDPRIQPNDISGLSRGSWVKVSAYQRADGSFVASRIDLDFAPGELQIRGASESVDDARRTLRIGDLTVDYSAATTEGRIAEGAVVLARGVQPQAGGMLFATELKVFNGVGQPGEKGDIEGIITAFTSSSNFEVNGEAVQTNSKTAYVLHGQTLGVDFQVRVTGHFDEAGVLIAQKVQAPKKPSKAQHGRR
jgi:Domain of unknown function (DUF5666)